MSKVLLTRPYVRSSERDELHHLLVEAGIVVQELPMLRFERPRDSTELDDVLSRAAVGEFAAIVLSSPTAVLFLHERAEELALTQALAINGRFATVGNATAEALETLGYSVSFPIPGHAGSHQLAALLASQNLEKKSVLLLQSQIGLEILEHSLLNIGARPERVTLYYTKGPSIGDSARLLHLLEGNSRPDVIAFFSPSSVSYFIRSLAEMASGMLRNLPAIACIGETTAKAVEEALHRRPEIVARKANQRSLAEDILIYLGLRNLRN